MGMVRVRDEGRTPAAAHPGWKRPALLLDSRTVHVAVPPANAFAPIQRIGGAAGWYACNWLWHIRGALDRMIGGDGFRRGRRDPERLSVGDAVDCWRVEAYEPGRRLRLALEWRIPGKGWLEFEVQPNRSGSIIRQTASYDPSGLAGRLYWYLSYPFHQLIFRKMLGEIAARATGDRSHERNTV